MSRQILLRHTRIKLFLFEAIWVNGAQKGQMIASIEAMLRLFANGQTAREEIADCLDLPTSLVHSVEDIYQGGTTDPRAILEQIDLNREDLAEWRAASERRGIKLLIEENLRENVDLIPKWVLERIKEAPETDLEKWLYAARRYRCPEGLFHEREMGQQALQLPPEPGEAHHYSRGVRRLLRIQIMERFGDIPYKLDESLYREDYHGLIQISRRLVHASQPADLFPSSTEHQDPSGT